MYIVAYEPTLRRTFKSFTSAPESREYELLHCHTYLNTSSIMIDRMTDMFCKFLFL